MHSIGGVYDTAFWLVSDLQLVLKPWPSVLVGFCISRSREI